MRSVLAELRPSEGTDLLLAAFDRIDDGILVFDSENRLALWNRRMVILAPALDLASGRRREDLAESLRQLEHTGLTCNWSIAGDGISVCLVRSGAVKAEQMRLARASLDHAVQAQARYLATANHDLRQPLQALGMLVGILASRSQPPEDAKLVCRIGEAVSALEAQLGNLLEISKIDAGRVEPAITDFSLASLFDNLAMEFQEQAAVLGLRLRVVASSARVHSDSLLLGRMIRQLLANALQCTEQGGVLLGCRRRGRLVKIEVRDTGFGIAEADRHLMFREFHRGPGCARGRSQGLGLGLAIVSRLARILGHQIGVSSSTKGGAVFAIAVPVAERPPGSIKKQNFELCGGSLAKHLN